MGKDGLSSDSLHSQGVSELSFCHSSTVGHSHCHKTSLAYNTCFPVELGLDGRGRQWCILKNDSGGGG